MYEVICTCGYHDLLKDARDLSRLPHSKKDPVDPDRRDKHLECPNCGKVLEIRIIS